MEVSLDSRYDMIDSVSNIVKYLIQDNYAIHQIS